MRTDKRRVFVENLVRLVAPRRRSADRDQRVPTDDRGWSIISRFRRSPTIPRLDEELFTCLAAP
jgi:hypothetical protein